MGAELQGWPSARGAGALLSPQGGSGGALERMPAARWKCNQFNPLLSPWEIPGSFHKRKVPFANLFWWGSCLHPGCTNKTSAESKSICTVLYAGLPLLLVLIVV